MAEYFHWVVVTADAQSPNAVFYAITSRKHQKWYAGRHAMLRSVNGKDVPGHPERRAEHVEGMVHPEAARNTGAKYRLWKPYQVSDQCMIPLREDTEDRIERL